MPKLKSGTVWPTDEENAAITEAAMADPDARPLTDEEWKSAKFKPFSQRGRPRLEATKDSITIRLSPEVTEYFRSTGKGWQTRIDEVLREYVAKIV